MSAEPARAGHTFGKFALVEKLGEGGMAQVWRATLRGTAGFERTVVVKRILAAHARDADFVKMFVREARVCALLHHRNIVQVFDFGKEGEEYFLAMEYVDGRTLLDVMRTWKGRLPSPGVGAMVARELAHALAYAHELADASGEPLRLIHRDVTLSNVMIARDGGVKLMDFGIAKALASSSVVTAAGTLMGKIAYMAPEQLRGATLDHRADLFSLGVVLHEMLTGERLFRGASDEEAAAKIESLAVPPPSRLNPAVPPELDDVCLRALERDPDRRFQGAEEMAARLDAIVKKIGWSSDDLSAQVFGTPTAGIRGGAATSSTTSPTELIDVARRAQPSAPRSASFDGSAHTTETFEPPRFLLPRARRLAPFVAAASLLVGFILWIGLHRAAAPPSSGAVAPRPIASSPGDRVKPGPSALRKLAAAPPLPPAKAVRARPLPLAAPAPPFHVDSSPSGAAVFVEHEARARGATPLDLPATLAGRRVSLRLAGYAPQAFTLSDGAPGVIALRRLASPEPAARPRHVVPVDVERGAVVDPFAP